MISHDTIVAISTPPGRGGIGIVRLSGLDSQNIAASIFRSDSLPNNWEPNRVLFGHIIDFTKQELIDEAILIYFKAPRSYTGEDVVELSCHGSPLILGRVLRMAVDAGARIAEPGEFTLRAFLNKKIDLAQAQAVRDLINAQTQFQASVANRQLAGALSRKLTSLKDLLVEVIVHLESSIEFVEDDISPETVSTLLRKLAAVTEGLSAIADSFSFGRFVRDGFDLAIVGRPNVGKSSIFNRLVGADRAIVTEFPGTTRDALHESTSISGIPVRLIDTAGIRETVDLVENIGVTRTRSAIADADIVMVVLDGAEKFSQDDLTILGTVSVERRILAINKSDLPQRLDVQIESLSNVEWTRISALTGDGFDLLTDRIFKRLAGSDASERDDVMLTDVRQYTAVRTAIEQLAEAQEMIRKRELEEIVLLRLRGALSAIGEITGETLTEDILNQIFSTFCIGK